MKIETSDFGYSRFVYLIGEYAIKVPYCRWGWYTFVRGLYHNTKEIQIWAYVNRERPEQVKYLCPVVRSLFGGLIVVMRRAETGLCEYDISAQHKLEIRAARLHGDDQTNNYGRLDGRIVKLDYADCYNVYD